MFEAIHIRGIKALQDAGVTRLEHVVLACLVMDDRPWSISSLSDATGYTRAAIRNTLRCDRWSHMTHRDRNGGYTLRRAARAFAVKGADELMGILDGSRSGWSTEIASALRKSTK